MAKSKSNLDSIFTDTANAIRRKTGGNEVIYPVDFADSIDNLPGPSGSITLEQNGEYNVGDYLTAVVNVPDEPTAVDELKKLYTGQSVNVTIKTGITSLAPYRFYNFDSLKSIDFNQVTSIPQYTCYDCNNLETVNLSENTTSIGSYAFYRCSKLSSINIPNTITDIGSYAFYDCTKLSINFPQSITDYGNQCCYNLGRNNPATIFGLTLDSTTKPVFNSYAFYYSNINYITGAAGNLYYYSFAYCDNLKQIYLTDATLSDYYVFYYTQYVENTLEKPSKIIATLNGNSSYDFYNFARYRSDNNYLEITLKAGTATTIGDSCFASDSQSTPNKYLSITLPANITTISSYAFRNNDHLALFLNSAPTLSSSSVFSGCTNSIVSVEDITLYDNLLAQSAWNNLPAGVSIVCRCLGSKYGLGAELPPYTPLGYKLTWYTDDTYTTEITYVENEQAYYYVKKTGTVREAAWITEIIAKDCNIILTDKNTGKIYKQGDYILLNTDIVVTTAASAEHPDWQLAKLRINRSTLNEGDTYTVTDDVVGYAMYTWNGEIQGWIFGVRGITSSSMTLTRIEDSEYFTWTKNSDGIYQGDFNEALNFERVTDNSGNVFIRIPILYRKWDGGDTLYISSYPADVDFKPYDAFRALDGTLNEFIDIGAYKMNQNGASKTGETKYQAFLSTQRTQAQAFMTNNPGYYYFEHDLRVRVLLTDLYFVVFARMDLENAPYSYNYTGRSDAKYITNLDYPQNICAFDSTCFKFFGVEDFWGVQGEYVDGIYINSSTHKVWYSPYPDKYNNNGTDYIETNITLAQNTNAKGISYNSDYPFVNVPISSGNKSNLGNVQGGKTAVYSNSISSTYSQMYYWYNNWDFNNDRFGRLCRQPE